ncbi:MAG: VWA domain-containing protein [Candidatus Dormibacteraeota bacterium]|nr:VWA domain-containing protein [Candidatus Dormibacteraeota bacterium]
MALKTPIRNRKTAKAKVADVNVIAILDMSGSMQGREVETRGGFNAFLANAQEDQRDGGGKITLSLTCFDTVFEPVYPPTPVDRVKPIGPKEYTPRGMTALHDAIGLTLSPLRFPKGEKVMVIITTDGLENSSHEWTAETVKKLIEDKEKLGWEFLFMGVGLDAFAASKAFASESMLNATLSTPMTAGAVELGMSFASSSMRLFRRGDSLSDSVAALYDDPASGLIDRSVDDQRPAARPSEASTAAVRRGKGRKRA